MQDPIEGTGHYSYGLREAGRSRTLLERVERVEIVPAQLSLEDLQENGDD